MDSKVIILVALVTVPAVSAKFSSVGNSNDYIDQVIENTKLAVGSDIDPLPLPDHTASFEKKILLITYTGEAKLFDGYISGLSSLHRTGDCTIAKAEDLVSIFTDIGFNKIEASYKGEAKFMELGPSIVVTAKIDSIRIKMGIAASTTDKDSVLQSFELSEITGIEVRIGGLGLLNWIFNLISNLVVKILKKSITTVIERQLRNAIANEITKIKFPVDI
ncbi:mite allergen Der f 7-like [Tachypleus tridentatus]|uniref:mite allergen Der f 7-like n=1 Tax=Tachypleus tridentatus TaxID=6853 RepID=UPI003FCF4FF9